MALFIAKETSLVANIKGAKQNWINYAIKLEILNVFLKINKLDLWEGVSGFT